MNEATAPLDQHALWNGPAARAWIDEKDVLDRMFQPFEDMLTDHARRLGVDSVLDIGCGTGRTTFALADALGPQARCTGIDISEPMIEVAQQRAQRDGRSVEFIAADAQHHAFAAAAFDLFVSRFGVMFFDEPVTAFANLRRAARPGASLCCIAWRSATENPFMTTAEHAAAPLLPAMPPRRLDGPGQFAFADRRHTEAMLQQAGWNRIAISPLDVSCSFPADKLLAYLTRLGPLGVALQSVDEAARPRVIEVVRTAFEPFVQGDEVVFDAACWCVDASA
jgi:SAM-dependent methyltransferase